MSRRGQATVELLAIAPLACAAALAVAGLLAREATAVAVARAADAAALAPAGVAPAAAARRALPPALARRARITATDGLVVVQVRLAARLLPAATVTARAPLPRSVEATR